MINGHGRSIAELLQQTGPGRMANTPYDTAWIARLGDIDKDTSDAAFDWICENQLPDGSWGAKELVYYHDRIICTLAAMSVLARRGRRATDRRRIEKGIEALESLARGATKGLNADPGGATVGFELIVPTLLGEAETLGILPSQSDRILGRLARQRELKMALLSGQMISRYATAAFSAEMAGPDAQRLLDINNLQEANGSVGNSPSATSYFATQVRVSDDAALSYIHDVVQDGGAPNVAPFDVFERSWVLWNLTLAGTLDSDLTAMCQPHLDFLQTAWQPGEGVSPGAMYTPRESDDTSVTYEVLTKMGRSADVESILAYEGDDHFRCFQVESNPSISANIHVLSALRQAQFEPTHPSIEKILRYLMRAQIAGTFWFDKWHASPYYPTAHAIIACTGYADPLVESSVRWILATQNDDGSWGRYLPTAEESAYCLQALLVWQSSGKIIPKESIARGLRWLTEHSDPPFPPLWIGKCLYSPELVIRSATLSVARLAAQT